MIRLKSLPAHWREKAREDIEDCAGKANSKRMSKSKDNIKNQSYGSFEAILEWNNGTYRIKEVLK